MNTVSKGMRCLPPYIVEGLPPFSGAFACAVGYCVCIEEACEAEPTSLEMFAVAERAEGGGGGGGGGGGCCCRA